jgi:hypothetical protein
MPLSPDGVRPTWVAAITGGRKHEQHCSAINANDLVGVDRREPPFVDASKLGLRYALELALAA